MEILYKRTVIKKYTLSKAIFRIHIMQDNYADGYMKDT